MRPFLCAFALAVSGLLTPQTHAQASGTITGSVIDASTGKFLEGADVSVEGTNLRAVSEREGRFTVTDVPAGPRTIVVSYPGLEASSSAVTVSAGQAATTNVRLGSGSSVQLTEFKVTGTSVRDYFFLGRSQPCAFSI